MKKIICFSYLLYLSIVSCMATAMRDIGADSLLQRIDTEVRTMMEEGHIPGLSLVIVDSGRQVIRTYGHADLNAGTAVTPQTLFQLGSCSKAFTALGVMQLAEKDLIALDSPVAAYIPWFELRYKGKPAAVTVRQLLYHTSGISWQTISVIPVSNAPDALTATVCEVCRVPLKRWPGSQYEYATVNYDILALIIEKVTHQPFEAYLQEVFATLGMQQTTVGEVKAGQQLATGYKNGFFNARAYEAPVYRGNNAAGYIISNAADMLTWLRFQLGLLNTPLYGVAVKTHQRDETVPLHGMSAYAMGWEVSLSGNRELYHAGDNPNYTAYVALRPHYQRGVVVLANSNSSYTAMIGDRVMKLVSGEKIKKTFVPDDGNDRIYSFVTLVLSGYMLVAVAYLLCMIRDIIRGACIRQPLNMRLLWQLLRGLLILLPFAFALYIFPQAIAGFSWQAIIVWSPASLPYMVAAIAGAVTISYVIYFVTTVFVYQKVYIRVVPPVLLMSILSGLASIVVIILVTSALESGIRLRYQLLYYVLVLAVYLLGRRFVQISLIRFSRNLIYDLRAKLINRIMATSYEKFEQLDKGRVYTTINDDIEMIGGVTDQFISLLTNVFTIGGAFLYLSFTSFWATVLAIGLILSISTVYYFVSRRTVPFFESARDTRNVFMGLIYGMVEGFKEISLWGRRKQEYEQDIANTSDQYRQKIITANIRFGNAYLLGESLLILLLGMVVFGLPRFFPGIRPDTITSFVIVILYLIGPIHGILDSVPAVMQLKIAWVRIQQFIREIPANQGFGNSPVDRSIAVDSFRLDDIQFRYKGEGEQEGFEVGPVNMELKKGEICFVVGGNGSGKTTLAKLITGLYAPDKGTVFINDKEVNGAGLGEYFSTVFTPAFLFEKLYAIDMQENAEKSNYYLRLLNLHKKVSIRNGSYSTIHLSGGQRKRLALFQCCLEDSPIYLFDELAADQDAEHRHFFYRTLLPQMKESGKIIIAITHDEFYFDVADKVLKIDQGKVAINSGSIGFTSPVS